LEGDEGSQKGPAAPELSGKSLRLGAKHGIVSRLDAPRRSEIAFETIRKFLK
jgi:hypothetical protein